MSYIAINGRPVAYRLLGDTDKPLLVLAHPLGMTQAVWDDLLPGLLPRFRVLTWDLPGHGASAALDANQERITPEALAEEALELARHAGADRFHFVGTSIGGVIGQQLIKAHAESLLSVMLTNTGAVIGTPDAWQSRAADVREKGLPVMAEGIVPRWFGPAACDAEPALLDGWRVAMGRGDAHSYALLCEMLGACNFRDAFNDVGVPLSLVGGEEDAATPPSSLQALAEELGAEAPSILENVGHVPSVERPDLFLALILKHLSR